MLEIGAVSRKITPAVGLPVQGAGTNQRALRIRDELEVNALCLRQDGVTVAIAGVDLALLPDGMVARAAGQIQAKLGDDVGLVLSATHTHAGPVVYGTNPRKTPDPKMVDDFADHIAAAVLDAHAALAPGKLGVVTTQTPVGYCRRTCLDDGSHQLGGNPADANNTGVEGPSDPTHTILACTDEQGKLIALLHANAAHPTMFYGADFFSAEYPGEARKFIRQQLGDLPVLYLNGPIGDQGPLPIGKSGDREARVVRLGMELAAQVLRVVLDEMQYADDVAIMHDRAAFDVPLRQPDPQTLQAARKTMERFHAGEELDTRELFWAHGRVWLADAFHGQTQETLHVTVLRIGPLALAAHPCELYCQFGLDLRRRSPAPHLIIADVSNGMAGYLPTLGAMLGGGYSAEPFYWSRLRPEAGHLLVDYAAKLLHQLWRG